MLIWAEARFFSFSLYCMLLYTFSAPYLSTVALKSASLEDIDFARVVLNVLPTPETFKLRFLHVPRSALLVVLNAAPPPLETLALRYLPWYELDV